MIRFASVLIPVVAAIGLTEPTVAGDQPDSWIIPVGFLPGGAAYSYVLDISADAAVVVGQGGIEGGAAGLVFTLEELQALPDLPGGDQQGAANACSADGTQIVGYGVPGDEAWMPVRWNAGVIESLPLPQDAISGEAMGISDDGLVIVGRARVPMSVACRWTGPGGFEAITALPTTSGCRATAVSGDGVWIVGHCTTAQSTPHGDAFRWSAETGAFELGDLAGGAYRSEATDVSSDGSVIVGRSESEAGLEAYRWTEASGMIGLGDLPGGDVHSYAAGVSRSGAIVVGFGRIDDPASRAFVWDEHHGMQNLESLLATEFGLVLKGWDLTIAWRVAVTPRAVTFIGRGVNESGEQQGWVARVARDCQADLTSDLSVDVHDLLAMLGAWGVCTDKGCDEDLDDDGLVGAADLATLLHHWGVCSPW